MSKRSARPSLPRHRRRRRGVRVWSAVGAVLVLLALMWADRSGWLLYDGDVLSRYDGRSFLVERVVDGDTLIIRAPDGGSPTTRIRLWGIDCPELADRRRDKPAEPWAEAARDRARELVDGRRVYLELEPHAVRDGYDRILAYVQMPDGSWLNEQLLIEGLAFAEARWLHRHLERYDLLERQAESQGVGVWERGD